MARKKAKVFKCPSCGAEVKEGTPEAERLPRCPNCADIMQEKVEE
jgi:DNA-directed RNA polymerase subunit RPC12/RpoP